MAHILIIGCGYSGERLAALHLARGDTVTGTTRDGDRARRLRAAGAEVLQRDLDAFKQDWPKADRVYYTAPPPSQGVTDPRLHRVLDALPSPSIFIYFSTTGVYGDHAGSPVNERTPVAASTDRARQRVDAERQVLGWCAPGCQRVILRVAGIYGPGRLPLEKLRRGEPVAESVAPGNRIHVDDLARGAVAVADSGDSGIWNVSDGNPLPTPDFNDLVARAAGLPTPRRVPLSSPEVTPGVRSFLSESRRVDNSKLLKVAGFQLLYPNPADGVSDSITR